MEKQGNERQNRPEAGQEKRKKATLQANNQVISLKLQSKAVFQKEVLQENRVVLPGDWLAGFAGL
jgi:hypothetical protein